MDGGRKKGEKKKRRSRLRGGRKVEKVKMRTRERCKHNVD